MDKRLYTYTFTAAQCHVLACACAIEVRTVDELVANGETSFAKWASMLRELQVLLDVTNTLSEPQEGGAQ